MLLPSLSHHIEPIHLRIYKHTHECFSDCMERIQYCFECSLIKSFKYLERFKEKICANKKINRSIFTKPANDFRIAVIQFYWRVLLTQVD